jgi:hypothetical protein
MQIEIKDLKTIKLASLKYVLIDAVTTKKLVIIYANLKEPEDILKATFIAEILSKQNYSCGAQIRKEEMIWNCKP